MDRDKIRSVVLKQGSSLGSGRVRQFVLPRGKIRITQITTFCPDIIGPGPTHLYLVESDALVLLDAGIPTHLAKAFFYYWRNQPMPPEVERLSSDHGEKELLEGIKLAGYSVSDIDLMIISHGHLDHFFMGGAIVDRSKARVSAHVLDTPEICNPWLLLNIWISRQPQVAATGMPAPVVSNRRIREALDGGFGFETLQCSLGVDLPIFWDGPLRLDGSAIAGIEARHLPGHTRGSIGLLVGSEGEEKVLLAGDVLLYPITPHPDDLLVYLQTLKRLEAYDDTVLVLPAHGKAIHNIKARVEFLQEHHKRRLKQTFEACHRPRCVWDIATMRNYFDTYVDPAEFNPLASLEALVHMELLTMVHGLHRSQIKNGVHYFQNSGESFDSVCERILGLVEDGVRGLMRY
jgi:glyoxylase-like metal-dependent hydrolase (beta-lactamase superfamily II)